MSSLNFNAGEIPSHYGSGGTYVASGVIVAAGPARLIGISGYNSKASAQFVMLFDAAAVPADATAAVYVMTVPASSNFSFFFGERGMAFNNGICWSNSSTAPTKTIGSADCFLEARYN